MLNRRLNRLKDTIINSNKINFIHLLDVDPNLYINSRVHIPLNNTIKDFIYNVYKINNNLDFTLHLLIPPGYYEDNINLFLSLHQIENKINLSENIFLDKDILPGTSVKGKLRIHIMTKDYEGDDKYQCIHWSWNSIYKIIINNNIPNDFNLYYYRKLNSDLHHMNYEELIIHYLTHGINEHRKYKIELK
jgi:hypothetical protein